ncbi:hypothetical protein R6Z07F_020306 [Ovis aries]
MADEICTPEEPTINAENTNTEQLAPRIEKKEQRTSRQSKTKVQKNTSLVVQWLRICVPTQSMWFSPWFGKIPHAEERLNSQVTTTNPACLEPHALQQEKPPQ